MISAANPDGSDCSAQPTIALADSSRSAPTTVAFRQCSGVGRAFDAANPMTDRIAPAIENLTPAMRKGGMVSIAKRIARNVEPQTK